MVAIWVTGTVVTGDLQVVRPRGDFPEGWKIGKAMDFAFPKFILSARVHRVSSKRTAFSTFLTSCGSSVIVPLGFNG
jgi:hypothetical protein